MSRIADESSCKTRRISLIALGSSEVDLDEVVDESRIESVLAPALRASMDYGRNVSKKRRIGLAFELKLTASS